MRQYFRPGIIDQDAALPPNVAGLRARKGPLSAPGLSLNWWAGGRDGGGASISKGDSHGPLCERGLARTGPPRLTRGE